MDSESMLCDSVRILRGLSVHSVWILFGLCADSVWILYGFCTEGFIISFLAPFMPGGGGIVLRELLFTGRG